MDVWVEGELDGCDFPDQRLKDRLGKLLGDRGRRIGGTIPAACQDWAATKAAYRFFSNPRVDEAAIPAGHFAATATRDAPEGVGRLLFVKSRHVTHTACGVLLHSSLALTPGGVPLGLAAVKFWT